MERARTVGELRTRIRETLGPLISRDFCLLDIPNHANSGDHFIYAGERRFLKDRGIVPAYESQSQFLDRKKISPGSQVLLQGGGNFGDVYPRHHAYREKIIATFTEHPILSFPQTVWFKSEANLRRCADLFARHPDVTVCARDAQSLRILTEHFPGTKSVLVPDMAFCLELPQRDPSESSGGRVLCIWQQDDVESGNPAFRALVPRNAENRDWPVYEQTLVQMRYTLAFAANRVLLTLTRSLGIIPHPWLDATALLVRHPTRTHIQEAVSMLRSYDLIITERLHGHIIACLMGIPSILLDNSYGKCAAFYDTWMKDIPGSYFAGSPDEFEHIMHQLGI